VLFNAARRIGDGAARARYLREAAGGDERLRRRVEALLAVHDAPDRLLDRPAVAGGETGPCGPATGDETASVLPHEGAGTRIGLYQLLQPIGEGGMGTVFLAEQTQPVQRRVALKVIKPGMDSRQVIARFEAERQALALMDHVNIARVFDGGTTENGRPYFVMELVHGVPITRYCDDHRLTPRERLELFVPVCQAIQHAHQKGIIHRDIKPSNVMVTLCDGQPVPKVIDFGVAKATEQQLTERTLFTQYGTLVGTLEYMSPEQAEMSALGVDTRSDIFSLGVLLYELLTGSTPLSHKMMKEAAYGEILRMIKEEEPPKPSTRLSDSGEALASISAQRQMEPAKLSKLMRGELDWIVMKTLEKDRSRRYETANAFAADVQRYLADETVQACPPSKGYRFRKFARRNKRALVTATLLSGTLLAAVVLAVVVLVVSNVAISRERDEKAAALKQKGEALEQKAEALVRTNEARVKAQRNAERAEANFQATLGVVDQMLGAPSAGTSTISREKQRIIQILNEKACQIFQELVDKKTGNPEERLQLAWAYVHLAKAEGRLDDRAKEAIANQRKAIALFEQLAADSPDVPNYRFELVRCYYTLASLLNRTPSPRALIGNIAILVVSPHQPAPLLAVSRIIHGGIQGVGPDFPEAKPVWLHAVALCDRLAADFPDHPDHPLLLAQEYSRLANRMPPGPEKVAAYASAAAASRSAAAIRSKLATDFPARPESRRWLADRCDRLAGELPEGTPEAAKLLQQALVIRQKLVEDFHQPGDIRGLASHYIRQGALLEKQGRPREAVEPYRQAMVVCEQLPDPQKSGDERPYQALGRVLKDSGQPGEAEKIYRKSAEFYGARLASIRDWPRFDSTAHFHYLQLGHHLWVTGRLPEAEQAFREGLAQLAKLAALDEQLGLGMKWGPPESQPMHRLFLADRYVMLSEFFKKISQPQKAEQAYRQAVDVHLKLAADCYTNPMYRRRLAQSYADLGKFLKDTGQPQKAGQAYGLAWEAWREAADLDQALDKKYWPWHIGEASAVAGSELGEGLAATGQLQEAEQAYRRAADVLQRLTGKNQWNRPDPNVARYRLYGALTLARLGGLLAGQGKHIEAAKVYCQAIELDPKSATAHYDVALALQNHGKQPEAITHYRKAIELDPKYAAAHGNLGNALYLQGKLDEAITCYRKAIELDPKIAIDRTKLSNALVNEGWNLANHPDAKLRDPKRAVELGKEGIELAPKSSQALQYLGWIQYRAGNWKASIEALEKSCKLQPGGTGDHGQWIVLALAHARLAAQADLPAKEREHHKSEARRRYEDADKLIDSGWRVRPGHAMGQDIWDFRTEARELMGVKKQ
jgi:serine/threonine protein kinase/Tfp pilus assembly protein PilF